MHAARPRAVAGNELLPADGAGRVLLARHAGHGEGRDGPGGAVDAGEPPAAAAVRKAREQISADVRPVPPGGRARRARLRGQLPRRRPHRVRHRCLLRDNSPACS